MNIFKRGMVFTTFFGSCIAIALLLASMGTKHWVNAAAKRTKNPQESNGKIHFGLFDGKKELNVAYGWRVYEVDIINQMKYDPDFMIYGFWLGTVVTICLGILFSGLSGIFAITNTATTTERYLTGVSGLNLWNFLACLSDVCAIGFWIAQYYLKLQYNVMSIEDKRNEWTSDGMAELSYSFWFVVGAAVASFVNIIIILIATSEKDVDPVIPVLEEKTNGAIMLY